MTLGFMSLLAATLNERISVKTGTRSLIPLLIFGVASVLYWNVTLARGHNDLRRYVVAQFGSLLALLLLVARAAPTSSSPCSSTRSRKSLKPPTARFSIWAALSAATQ
jgi:hypothetical protein